MALARNALKSDPPDDRDTGSRTGDRRHADRVALTAFIASCVLAGGNAVSIRFSNRELDPLWGAALRFSLAALVLLAVMAALRLKLPRGRALAGPALFGTLNFGLAFALIYFALVRLHGGFGQVVYSLLPLATLLLAVAWRQERFTVAAVAGIVPAVVGVAVLSWQTMAGAIPVVYLLALIGGVVCSAQATVLVRRFPPVHPVTMTAMSMTVGAGLLLAGSALAGDDWALPQLAATRWAVAYMVLGGSVGTFVLFMVVLQRWSASRTTYNIILVTFITVMLSVWLDDEPIGIGLLVGGPLILAGVYIGAIRPSRTPSPAAGRAQPGSHPDRIKESVDNRTT
jgi:drug/metabolite transporter (DMT)-like permease